MMGFFSVPHFYLDKGTSLFLGGLCWKYGGFMSKLASWLILELGLGPKLGLRLV